MFCDPPQTVNKKGEHHYYGFESIFNEIDKVLGRKKRDEFWLTILSLRTYIDSIKEMIKTNLLNYKRIYNKLENSTSVIITWEGFEFFRKIFIEYARKAKHLNTNLPYEKEGIVYFFCHTNTQSNNIKDWFKSDKFYSSVGVLYGTSSSSRYNPKLEICVPLRSGIDETLHQFIRLKTDFYFSKKENFINNCCYEGHELVSLKNYEIPETYNKDSMVECDICSIVITKHKGIYFNCPTCKFDICYNCKLKEQKLIEEKMYIDDVSKIIAHINILMDESENNSENITPYLKKINEGIDLNFFKDPICSCCGKVATDCF